MGKTTKGRKSTWADESFNVSGQAEATPCGPTLGKTSRSRKKNLIKGLEPEAPFPLRIFWSTKLSPFLFELPVD